MSSRFFSIAAVLLLLPAAALPQAAGHGSQIGSPFSTPADAEAGAAAFKIQCGVCHGADGTGSTAGPPLHTGVFKRGASDEAIFGVITKGVPGTPMPAFNLDGRSVWQMIAFIRSLNVSRIEHAKGDAARGEQVFLSAGCVKCHNNGRTGAYTGPDLSEIGSQRSLAALESAILEPNAQVHADYWTLRARTKGGENITGIRLNEDMDTYQIRDASGRLRTLRKADLASHEIIQTSPMPAFRGKLQGADLDNLIAYLASLRAPATQPEVAAK
jgi:putative heme-binding domain-containing protein